MRIKSRLLIIGKRLFCEYGRVWAGLCGQGYMNAYQPQKNPAKKQGFQSRHRLSYNEINP
ncbi:hypothetical protein CAP50_10185 [Psychrobacter sp. L7]|nr:hypothetical protein CAP50_10185 [Psychrobacter sp. L7]